LQYFRDEYEQHVREQGCPFQTVAVEVSA